MTSMTILHPPNYSANDSHVRLIRTNCSLLDAKKTCVDRRQSVTIPCQFLSCRMRRPASRTDPRQSGGVVARRSGVGPSRYRQPAAFGADRPQGSVHEDGARLRSVSLLPECRSQPRRSRGGAMLRISERFRVPAAGSTSSSILPRRIGPRVAARVRRPADSRLPNRTGDAVSIGYDASRAIVFSERSVFTRQGQRQCMSP